MKKILASVVICSAALTGCTTEPDNFKGLKYGARGYPHAGTVFEIAPEIGATRFAYWCAGSEYARRFLGAGWNTRFYVLRGMGEGEVSGRRSTVLFTLDPVAGSQSGSSIAVQTNAFNVGDYRTVSSGESACDPFLMGRF